MKDKLIKQWGLGGRWVEVIAPEKRTVEAKTEEPEGVWHVSELKKAKILR